MCVCMHIFVSRLISCNLSYCHVLQDKVNAARNLIAKLRSEKSSLVTTISQLCEAYTDLAYHDVTAFRKQTCE